MAAPGRLHPPPHTPLPLSPHCRVAHPYIPCMEASSWSVQSLTMPWPAPWGRSLLISGAGRTAGRTQKRGQRPTCHFLTWQPLRFCAEGEEVCVVGWGVPSDHAHLLLRKVGLGTTWPWLFSHEVMLRGKRELVRRVHNFW